MLKKNTEKSSGFSKLLRFVKWAGFLGSLVAVYGLVGSIVLYGLFRNDVQKVYSISDYRPALPSKVYAQNGALIAQLGGIEREMFKREDIPPLLIKAFLSAEDKNFYSHSGIDAPSVIKALLQSFLAERSSLRGASTITQQLAKSMLVKQDGYYEGTKRSFARKIKEAILARRLERHLSKDDILWIYLNEIYLGESAYGVAAAARTYFDKDLHSLTLGEMAILAGLPQAPARFSPYANFDAALKRQSYVLSRMQEDGVITEVMVHEALSQNTTIKIVKRINTFRKEAPYFSEMVRKKLVDMYGEDIVYEQGLNIYTTLNLDHAHAMQESLKNGLINIDKRQGFLGPIFRPTSKEQAEISRALMASINEEDNFALQPRFSLAVVESFDHEKNIISINTGHEKGIIQLANMAWARTRDPSIDYELGKLKNIRGALKKNDIVLVSKTEDHNKFSLEQEPSIEGAMISLDIDSGYITAEEGGYSFDKSEFNRIFQACRQPGSLFKPIVYATAITEKEYTPRTMVLDEPLIFENDDESYWEPQNFDKNFKGAVTVREALMNSMNIPTINIMADVTAKNVINFAHSLGIETTLKNELGTAIGSSCVTPVELAKVFSVFANLGVTTNLRMIREVTDRDHKRLLFFGHKDDPFIKRNDRVALAFSSFFAPKDRVMSQENAYITHYLLTEAARHGTAQRTLELGRHIAGKTGTTDDSYDAWFLGYSKHLLTLVWVGNDTMEKPLGAYEQGARTALPLFNQFMKKALANLPNQNWDMPKTLCMSSVDPHTGEIVNDDREEIFKAPFLCEESHMAQDPSHFSYP